MSGGHRPHSSNTHLRNYAAWLEDHRSSTKGLGSGSSNLDTSFVPRNDALVYIKRHAAPLITALFPDLRYAPATQDVVHNCSIGLAILLSIGKGEYIADFVQSQRLYDEHLPFLEQPYSFPRPPSKRDHFYEDFYDAQWEFCAHIFKRGHGLDLKLPKQTILPIIEKVRIDRRSTSIINRISIHEAHDELHDDQELQAGHAFGGQTYVMKTYRGKEAQAMYDTEVAAFKHIINARADENFVRFYGGFRHGTSLSIILEYANVGTLDSYFVKVRPPTKSDEIRQFWINLCNVLEGIYGLHGIPADVSLDFPAARGWHQDIKPSNILALHGSGSRACDVRFKVCDLGLSHFRLSNSYTGNPHDADVGGTREYGAPECVRPDGHSPDLNRAVGQSVDVWSFGCICLEAACWLIGDHAGLIAFRESRRHETEQKRHRHSDIRCFHDGSNLLLCVQEMINSVQQEATERDDHLTYAIVEQVKRMLVAADNRPTTHELVFDVRELLRGVSTTPRRRNTAHSSSNIDDMFSSGSSRPGRDPQFDSSSGTYGSAIEESPATSTSPSFPPTPTPRPRRHPTNRLSQVPIWSQAAAWTWYNEVKAAQRLREYPPPLPHKQHFQEMGKRDIVFLVDDVKSMAPHWKQVTETVTLLAYLLKGSDKNGMDLYFSTSPPGERPENASNSSDLARTLRARSHALQESSDISLRLAEILTECRKKMSRCPMLSPGVPAPGWPFLSRKPKPMNVYILTDGIWREHADPFSPIDHLVQTMRNTHYEPRHIGIQFVSFGNEPEGLEKMQQLDDNDAWRDKDVVDTEPYGGNVIKMVVGGIEKTFDNNENGSVPTHSLDQPG